MSASCRQSLFLLIIFVYFWDKHFKVTIFCSRQFTKKGLDWHQWDINWEKPTGNFSLRSRFLLGWRLINDLSNAAKIGEHQMVWLERPPKVSIWSEADSEKITLVHSVFSLFYQLYLQGFYPTSKVYLL